MFKKENKKKKTILTVGSIITLILLSSTGSTFTWKDKDRNSDQNTIKHYKL